MLATLRTSVSTLSASLEAKEQELQKCRAELADAKQRAQSLQQQLQDGQREAAAAQETVKQANKHAEDARREVILAQEAADKTLREAWQEASEQALREAARHHASAMREEKDAARRAVQRAKAAEAALTALPVALQLLGETTLLAYVPVIEQALLLQP